MIRISLCTRLRFTPSSNASFREPGVVVPDDLPHEFPPISADYFADADFLRPHRRAGPQHQPQQPRAKDCGKGHA